MKQLEKDIKIKKKFKNVKGKWGKYLDVFKNADAIARWNCRITIFKKEHIEAVAS